MPVARCAWATRLQARVASGALALLALGCRDAKGNAARLAAARASASATARPSTTPSASALTAPDAAHTGRAMITQAPEHADTTSAPAAQALPREPRLYAKSRFVWVYPDADATRQWVGFLRSGSSAALRDPKPHIGPGCDALYAVEPKGFVCADGSRATLSQDDAVYQALAPHAAKPDSPAPYHYAESLGAPRYFFTPTPELQRLREGDLRAHLRDVAEARAGHVASWLQGVDLSLPSEEAHGMVTLPMPVFEDRKELKRRSTVAYSAEARFGDRAFLLSADFAWIPKDRVRPYPAISFHGEALGKGLQLPLAFFRRKQAPQFRREGPGKFVENGAHFERLTHVALTGAKERVLPTAGGAQGPAEHDEFLETREAGVWLRHSDAVIPHPQALTPWGAETNHEDTSKRPPKGRLTWIEVSIQEGWLLAYEGTSPVYATLISPGRGGVALADEDPLSRSATPTGIYPISGKFLTSTMEAPGDLIHSDVPFAQNLVGPYAIHGAYWHDNWGYPQSGGCINLSPIDAKWMFEFTDPQLPAGWHGVRWIPSEGPATVVVLHR